MQRTGCGGVGQEGGALGAVSLEGFCVLRLLLSLVTAAGLLVATPLAWPLLKSAVRLVEARNDPAALADLDMRTLTPAHLQEAIQRALDADDPELAASALQWADANGREISPALRARVAEAGTGAAQALRTARSFGSGFVTGTPEDLPGFAGAAAGDLTLWGDLRDASREGWHYLRGEPVDPLLLGLSAAGLVLTAGTYATAGTGAPARMGLTLVKVARRTGKLSAGLLADVSRLVRESVDFAALRRGAGTIDAAALKAAVRPQGLARLSGLLSDVGTVQAKAGTRAALDGLALAGDGRDMTRLARLAEKKGGQTLFILRTLGRGALGLSGALLSLLWWGAAGLAWLIWLVSALNGLAVSLARLTWRRRLRFP